MWGKDVRMWHLPGTEGPVWLENSLLVCLMFVLFFFRCTTSLHTTYLEIMASPPYFNHVDSHFRCLLRVTQALQELNKHLTDGKIILAY